MTASLHLQMSYSFKVKRLTALAVPLVIIAYLAYVFVAFDIAGIAGRAKLDNAKILLADFVSFKTHVTRENRSGDARVAIEGESKGTYPEGRLPEWVTQSDGITTVDLGKGHIVTYDTIGASYVVPGYGTIYVEPDGGKVKLTAPQPLPDWINATSTRVAVTTPQGRFSYSRAKVDTFRYQMGWEMFFFTLDSPFSGKTLGELATILAGPRLDPARSNLAMMASEFWHNRMWHHSDVAGALFETVLMAFLGTMGAAMVSLPLAFLAASNFTPFRTVRFAFRRVFDFLRGVDGLIWTIILSRAFGPGPMTGALAILLTDTGTFGKTFSEALENIDDRQVEGVRSTGASALQRARFGVIPQLAPILLSQVLYYLESNTRSATVIGAIVGGGIGLLLTQAIITQKDWEEVAYYMVLIVLMVMAMDSLSGWIRRRFIKG
jgi:phosphonate transport system permease protein